MITAGADMGMYHINVPTAATAARIRIAGTGIITSPALTDVDRVFSGERSAQAGARVTS